ncbi:protein-tyrosine phosphatase family protein [Photobacterium sanctipauli]|nr:protein-tyrosine phosphatase family protein [Photobacterium sanctipauli]
MSIQGKARSLPFNQERDRFSLPHSPDTQVTPSLNANRIKVGDTFLAIASQYPFEHQLENHFKMLVENRTPVLLVLASLDDIERDRLPEYYAKSGQYGQIKTQVKLINKEAFGDGIIAKIYQLNVSGYDASVTIPVVHVFNWPDHQTVGASVTTRIVTLLQSIHAETEGFYQVRGSRAVLDENKLLPVIHCRAGVGRTGQIITAMAMQRYPHLSLENIIQSIRASRNDYMVQTPVQMDTLVRLYNRRLQYTSSGGGI